MADPGKQFPPTVQTGPGTITVTGHGQPGEAITIVVSQGGTQVTAASGNLDMNGMGSYTFHVPAGTYDVSVTAALPPPNGTVYDFPQTVVPS